MRMKNFLPFLSIAFVFAACSGNPETETKTLQSVNQSAASVDTAGLAQFQQWKAQNELTVADPVQAETTPVIQEPVKTVTVVREVIVERPAPVRKQTITPKKKSPVTPPTPAPSEPINTGTASNDNNVGSGTGAGTSTEAPLPTGETAKKEGWSKAAKGAAIGGAGGAVIGAVIGKKNPAVGAAIGGVLGGAVGYGIGKNKDKKDGRY